MKVVDNIMVVTQIIIFTVHAGKKSQMTTGLKLSKSTLAVVAALQDVDGCSGKSACAKRKLWPGS